MKLYFTQLQPNISWKASSNNNVTIIPKNVKNEIPDNTNIIAPWSEECPVKKYKFNALPTRRRSSAMTHSPNSSSSNALPDILKKYQIFRKNTK